MFCQKCGGTLADNATYCGCGWRKRSASNGDTEYQAPVPCAHNGCGIDAMCRIKTKTGWANLCWHHYDEHYRTEALCNLDKYGLAREPDETNAEWVARMRQFVRAGVRNLTHRAK
jgi:hypothetical protein